MARRMLNSAILAVWLALALLGAAGVSERVLYGHQAAAYGSYVVWGLWVSAYIYFIGLSAGSFLLSSLIYVFEVRELERVGRTSLFVAIITLPMALLSIWFDLGRMGRFYRVFTDPNFGSMMAWMVWLYTLYTIVITVELWLALRGDLARWSLHGGPQGAVGRCLSFSKGPLTERQEERGRSWLKTLAVVGIPLAFAFCGGVGALFGAVSARPFWNSQLMPILFLTGALVSGGALMAFVVTAFWPQWDEEHQRTVAYLGRVVLGLLLFDILLEWAEFSVPMWYGVGREYDLLLRILFGEFWWVFWVLHLGLGTLIPLALLLARGNRPWAVGLAGLLIAVTFMTVRLNIVIPSLIESHLEGLQNAFVHPRLVFSYVPSLFEWQVLFFVLAVGSALFFIGRRELPLVERRIRKRAS